MTPWRFAWQFAALFGLLSASFEAVRGGILERLVIDEALLRPTAWLLGVLDPAHPVARVGRTLVSDHAQLHVTRGCEGVEMTFLVVAAVAVFPAAPRRRLQGLLVGAVLAQVLAIARLAILQWSLQWAPDAWSTLHGLVLPLAPVAILTGYFLRWSEGAAHPDRAAQVAAHAG